MHFVSGLDDLINDLVDHSEYIKRSVNDQRSTIVREPVKKESVIGKASEGAVDLQVNGKCDFTGISTLQPSRLSQLQSQVEIHLIHYILYNHNNSENLQIRNFFILVKCIII